MSLVRTTVATEEQAKTVARRLVRARLAACVHVLRIESFYEWQGKPAEEGEWLVEARVPQAKAETAWLAVTEDHPYEVPLAELVPETRVNGAYARWAREVTGLAQPGPQKAGAAKGARSGSKVARGGGQKG